MLIISPEIKKTLQRKVYILHKTSSSLGFKHSEQSKKSIANFRMGRKHTDVTKQKLSEMLSGELAPFLGKSPSDSTLALMCASKLGEKNPMFNKEKSPEFIARHSSKKDRSGSANPMYGKKSLKKH